MSFKRAIDPLGMLDWILRAKDIFDIAKKLYDHASPRTRLMIRLSLFNPLSFGVICLGITDGLGLLKSGNPLFVSLGWTLALVLEYWLAFKPLSNTLLVVYPR